MSEWHPIDTAPLDGREILVWCDGPRLSGCYIAIQIDDEESWMEQDGAFCFTPDLAMPRHCMPLPPEPSKVQNGTELSWRAIASAPQGQPIIAWSPSWTRPRVVESRKDQWWTEEDRAIDTPTRWIPIPCV